MNTSTAQGAVARAVALNTFPCLAVPTYWVFGRTKFEGSIMKRRGGEEQAHPIVTGFIARAKLDGWWRRCGTKAAAGLPSGWQNCPPPPPTGWSSCATAARSSLLFSTGLDRPSPTSSYQKVTLVDSDLATVGSANFDNRSFRLNFGMTTEVRDPAFAGEVAAMLAKGFAQARRVDPGEASARGFLFQLKTRASILLSPIQ